MRISIFVAKEKWNTAGISESVIYIRELSFDIKISLEKNSLVSITIIALLWNYLWYKMKRVF